VSSTDRPPGRDLVSHGMQWARSRPWQVWASAGAVFVMFAVLGAVTHESRPAAADGRGLADALEQGTGRTPSVPGVAVRPNPGNPTVTIPTYRIPQPSPSTTPTPTPSASTAVFYADCAAAEAAGAAPIRRGRPGYRTALDRDGDGVACDAPVPGPPSPTAGPTGVPPVTVPPVGPTAGPPTTLPPTATPTETVAPTEPADPLTG
jgi:hypothetical protein